MPSKSGKQHRAMALAANDPAAAKRMGIPQDVAREFIAADRGKTFKQPHHGRGHKGSHIARRGGDA